MIKLQVAGSPPAPRFGGLNWVNYRLLQPTGSYVMLPGTARLYRTVLSGEGVARPY